MDLKSLDFRAPRNDGAASSAPKARGTQSIERASLLMRLIASRSRTGLQLVEIARHTKLQRPTVHRILKCLMTEGMVKQDPDTRRYFLGHLLFELGLAAATHYSLRDICHDSLMRLAEKTGDTVFLTVRSGFEGVCIDRREGSFPIKTLVLEVGTRRPLGVGAGGLALLMHLSDDAVQGIVSANAARLGAYNKLTVPVLLRMLRRCREQGYALNNINITPDALSVGVAIRSRYGDPFLAISIGAVASRMTTGRQQELVSLLKAEAAVLEKAVDTTACP